MNNNSRNDAITPSQSANKKYPTRSPNYITLGRTVVTVNRTVAGYLNRREERRLILFLVCHGEHKSLNPTDAPPCRFTARISRSKRMREEREWRSESNGGTSRFYVPGYIHPATRRRQRTSPRLRRTGGVSKKRGVRAP